MTRSQDFARNLKSSAEPTQIEITVKLKGDAAAAVEDYRRRWNSGEKATATQIANDLILIAIEGLAEDDAGHQSMPEQSGKPKPTEPRKVKLA